MIKKVRTCSKCGKEYQGHGNRTLCHDPCQSQGHRQARPRSCKTCGDEFMPIANQQYCDACGKPRRQAWKYRDLKGAVCEVCGFLPEHRCQLDIHHLDGDNENGSPENLQTLCANCHRLETWRTRHGAKDSPPRDPAYA